MEKLCSKYKLLQNDGFIRVPLLIKGRLVLPPEISREEIEDLVMQLAKTEMPYTCPHGRPTIIHTSFQELAKKFGRE